MNNTILETRVNNWLFKEVIGNNGELYTCNDLELEKFRNNDYCQELFNKIIKLLKKHNHVLEQEELFKDRLIYCVYKYSQK